MNEDRVREIVYEVLAERDARSRAANDQAVAAFRERTLQKTEPQPGDGPVTADIKKILRGSVTDRP